MPGWFQTLLSPTRAADRPVRYALHAPTDLAVPLPRITPEIVRDFNDRRPHRPVAYALRVEGGFREGECCARADCSGHVAYVPGDLVVEDWLRLRYWAGICDRCRLVHVV